MRLFTPIVPDPAAPLARANPVAKLVAALVLLVALFASLDGVTAGIILAGLGALLPVSGIRPRDVVARAWPLAAAAVAIGAFNALFAAEQLGPTAVAVGPFRVGAESLANGAGLALRLLAIVLAGILATATSDPTELADALVQQAHAPPRLAVGILAAVRLVPLLAREWQVIGLARRARGVDAGRSPIGAVRLFAGRLVALLVAGIRIGSRMATAMEGRGFGALECRSVARRRRLAAGDVAWVVGAVVLAAGAIGLSVAIGTWRPLI